MHFFETVQVLGCIIHGHTCPKVRAVSIESVFPRKLLVVITAIHRCTHVKLCFQHVSLILFIFGIYMSI